jgi:hypothetical protein
MIVITFWVRSDTLVASGATGPKGPLRDALARAFPKAPLPALGARPSVTLHSASLAQLEAIVRDVYGADANARGADSHGATNVQSFTFSAIEVP